MPIQETGTRVCIIEPYRDIRDLLKEVLVFDLNVPERRVSTITNHDQREKFFQEAERLGTYPDLVILDLRQAEDLAVLDDIRNRQTPLKNVPVITTSTDETLKRQSLEHGANAFFAKPYDIFALEKAAREYLYPSSRLQAA